MPCSFWCATCLASQVRRLKSSCVCRLVTSPAASVRCIAGVDDIDAAVNSVVVMTAERLASLVQADLEEIAAYTREQAAAEIVARAELNRVLTQAAPSTTSEQSAREVRVQRLTEVVTVAAAYQSVAAVARDVAAANPTASPSGSSVGASVGASAPVGRIHSPTLSGTAPSTRCSCFNRPAAPSALGLWLASLVACRYDRATVCASLSLCLLWRAYRSVGFVARPLFPCSSWDVDDQCLSSTPASPVTIVWESLCLCSRVRAWTKCQCGQHGCWCRCWCRTHSSCCSVSYCTSWQCVCCCHCACRCCC
jgi:hypothetical protein